MNWDDLRDVRMEPGEPPSPDTLRRIEKGLAADLHPVRPMPPASSIFTAFASIFVAIVAVGVYGTGAFGLGAMSAFQKFSILGALAISTGALVYSVVQQMAPGRLHRIRPNLLPFAILIALMVLMILLFQFEREAKFWTIAWSCLRFGVGFGALAAIPFWLILRRGAILSPAMTGAATGLLAGLVGTSVQEMHCPDLDAWHVLAAHLGASVVCALAGLLIGLAVDLARTLSASGSR